MPKTKSTKDQDAERIEAFAADHLEDQDQKAVAASADLRSRYGKGTSRRSMAKRYGHGPVEQLGTSDERRPLGRINILRRRIAEALRDAWSLVRRTPGEELQALVEDLQRRVGRETPSGGMGQDTDPGQRRRRLAAEAGVLRLAAAILRADGEEPEDEVLARIRGEALGAD